MTSAREYIMGMNIAAMTILFKKFVNIIVNKIRTAANTNGDIPVKIGERACVNVATTPVELSVSAPAASKAVPMMKIGPRQGLYQQRPSLSPVACRRCV